MISGFMTPAKVVVLALAIAAAIGIYMIRSSEAEQGAPRVSSSGDIQSQVPGRLVDWIKGEGEDGTAFDLFCEYDAFVKVTDNVISDVVDGTFGDSLTESKGRPVLRGEPVDHGDTDLFSVRAYRDELGDLQTGCAPESIRIQHGLSAPLGTPSP
jgi:hypothetical protein